MKDKQVKIGHLCALFTIIIWATTFVSTKVLLISFSPVEIMFFRFVIAYVVLLIASPHFIKYKNVKEELMFAASGLCGVTLYFLFQNTGLTYTLASNMAVLVSVAPLFTALISHYFLKSEVLRTNFFIGFAVAIIGIVIISFNGNFVLKLNPLGDLLAILSALVWAVYCIIMKKISGLQYNMIQSTRKVFFYGLLFMLPILPLSGFSFGLDRFTSMPNLFNLLFLGVGASAVCYLTWNHALKVLGPVKTSVYIYIIPVIAIGFSALLLHEEVTLVSMMGMVLILIGLYLSEKKSAMKVVPVEK
jgi:drug/metabolite transporter (DMT)-like permease